MFPEQDMTATERATMLSKYLATDMQEGAAVHPFLSHRDFSIAAAFINDITGVSVRDDCPCLSIVDVQNNHHLV